MSHSIVIKKEPYCCDDMYRAGRALPYTCVINIKNIVLFIALYHMIVDETIVDA